MRYALMLCVLAIAACRSGGEPAPPHSAPPPSITATPTEDAAPASATPSPTTATPADTSARPGATSPIAAAPSPAPASGGSGAPSCKTDSDCALSYVPAGDCCRRLCVPRVVTAEEARLTDERVSKCEKENRPCVAPMCRARAYGVTCSNGACVSGPRDDR